MSVRSGSKGYGKYEIQVFWCVVVSLLLAATMAVSSAEPIKMKPQPLPYLLEQAVANDRSSPAIRSDGVTEFLGANASQDAVGARQGGI